MSEVRFERVFLGILTLIFLVALVIVALREVREREGRLPEPFISQEAKDCYECHTERGISRVAIAEWRRSEHAEKGIGCNECHIPSKDAGEGILKEKTACEDKKVRRSVSYNNCKRCHEEQVNGFVKSIHFYAEKNLKSAVEFYKVKLNENECMTCHMTGREDKGCSSCHPHHSYSASYARGSQSCKSCHEGVYSYYTTSAHGRLFLGEKWDLSHELKEWRKGIDYPLSGIPLSPSCALCHMPDGNHSIGVNEEISFTSTILTTLSVRLKVPFKLDEKRAVNAIAKRKEGLRKLCAGCHPVKWSEERINEIYSEVEKASKGVLTILEGEGAFYNPHLIPSQQELQEPFLTIERWSSYTKMVLHFGKGDTY